ncbi:MAG: endolytic transglycosylase MltG [Erysipelotrichaceae bacterium]
MEQLKKLKRPYQIAILVVAVSFICAITFFFYYSNGISAVESSSKKVQFDIVQGDSVDKVIDRLDDKKIIKNASMAKLCARFNGLSDIKIGYFTLDPSKSTKDILKDLNNSELAHTKQAMLTFKEGIWAKDIANHLEKVTNVKASELISLWNDPTYLKSCIKQYPFLSDAILNEQYRVGLEGYLFPETYHFNAQTNASEITKTMLDAFDLIYKKHQKEFKESNQSIHDIVTLASMIQYEASSKEDMYKVSGVFANRMKIGMKLQSSVTVCYALYDELKSAEDCEVNPHIDSPYNTYLHDGLPIGPILNPGEVAIQAALHPEKHDYYYFMADIYGDKKVYYSKTLEEHQKYVDKYLNK